MLQGIRSGRDVVRAYHALRSVTQEGAWADAAMGLASRIAEPARHRALVTCGPPHQVHHAGRRLAARLRVPLVLDLRDPWSQVERLPESIASAVWLRVAARRERAAVAAARLVVANTEPAAEALRTLYPWAASRVVAIMNGYDEGPLPEPQPGERFTIAYAGSIYLDRDPGTLFRPAGRLVRELGIRPHEFAIELMGHVRSYDGVGIADLAREAGLEGYVRVHPPAPRSEVAALLSRATVLVSLPQDSTMAIPSKIFEYLQFPAWLLVMADPGSATGQALNGSGADIVPRRDEDRTYAVLRQRFIEYSHGSRPVKPAAAAHLSRRYQAMRFFDLLDEYLEQHEPPAAGPGRPRPVPAGSNDV